MVSNEDRIQAVWEKGRATLDRDPNDWRQDQCGAWLHRAQYDNPEAEFGWKMVRVGPGRPEDLDNLQPFHWRNSFDIENGEPHCRITADRSGLSPTQHVDQPQNENL